MKRTIVLLLTITLVQSFAFAQSKAQRPRIVTPKEFRDDPRPQPDSQTLADSKWFDVFKDPKLQELIHEALVNNYDVRESIARIDVARANLGLVRSEQYPQIYGSADVTTIGRSRDGELTLPDAAPKGRTFGSVLLNLLTFELDIWGRLRKQTQAARADLLASEEARKAVLTTIVAEVAASYFALRELDF